MSEITDVMILAAGFGNRMRPLTSTTPKPLIKVAGKTLLDRALDVAAHSGVAHAVVNMHYLADQMEAHCQARTGLPRIDISDERAVLLETGGGLKQALPLLKGDAFLVMNADNVWPDMPVLDTLIKAWHPETMDALLLVVPTADAVGYDGVGDFFLSAHQQPMWRGAAMAAPYIFTGAQILKRTLLDATPEGAFSLHVVFNRAMQAQRLFAAVHYHGWYHVGTPEGVALAEAALTKSTLAKIGAR